MRFRLITFLACMVLALAMLAACDSGDQEAMQQQMDSKDAEIAELKTKVESMESMSPPDGRVPASNGQGQGDPDLRQQQQPGRLRFH